jgi:hypothetical protein
MELQKMVFSYYSIEIQALEPFIMLETMVMVTFILFSVGRLAQLHMCRFKV